MKKILVCALAGVVVSSVVELAYVAISAAVWTLPPGEYAFGITVTMYAIGALAGAAAGTIAGDYE